MRFLGFSLSFVLLGITSLLCSSQDLDYSAFKTNDEENNIEIFKRSSPSVVHITNSRLVRSFY